MSFRPARASARFLAALAASIAVLAAVAGGALAADWVGLGDSYAAGPLIPNQSLSPLGCLRSDHNFAHLAAAGVDMDQIRTLARVLDEDTGLAPIWNWQTRGSVARAPSRRPRSLDAHGAVSTRATGQPQGDGKSAGATPRQRRSATGPSSDKTITDLTRPSASPAER